MKSLDNFASFEVNNSEDVKGGTFGLFSLLNCLTPKTNPCYTPPAPSCNTGGYSNPKPPVNCTPTPVCTPTIKISFSFSFGKC
ncbi:MAG: hypothetical protein ACK4NY_12090 [Spirosomataceae bacterium]